MNKLSETYFTIGEFASLFKLSKQTLFYYERNNILRPAYIDENGYRYYSLEQYFTQTSHTENIPYALINQLELNVESHSRTLLCTQTTHPKSGQIVQESFQERFDQQDF